MRKCSEDLHENAAVHGAGIVCCDLSRRALHRDGEPVLAGSPTPIEPVHCPAATMHCCSPVLAAFSRRFTRRCPTIYEGPEVKDILDSYAESVRPRWKT